MQVGVQKMHVKQLFSFVLLPQTGDQRAPKGKQP
jgi:hypothetical protein